jgi:hypothetical protein
MAKASRVAARTANTLESVEDRLSALEGAIDRLIKAQLTREDVLQIISVAALNRGQQFADEKRTIADEAAGRVNKSQKDK